jgi:hypothetical protein
VHKEIDDTKQNGVLTYRFEGQEQERKLGA